MDATRVASQDGRQQHRACARGLGIRRIHNPVMVSDTPQNRGMIEKIKYMLKVEER